jgi:hypothetical protein
MILTYIGPGNSYLHQKSPWTPMSKLIPGNLMGVKISGRINPVCKILICGIKRKTF